MLPSDRLFEPRNRLPWLLCELHPSRHADGACRLAPSHPHIYRHVCFLMVVFTSHVCVCWFKVQCSVGQVSAGMLRKWAVFLTCCSSLAQKTYPVLEQGCALPLVLCDTESISCLPTEDAKFHFIARCTAAFSFINGQTFLSPVLPSTAVAASTGQPSACVTATYLMWAKASGIHSYTTPLLMSSSAN